MTARLYVLVTGYRSARLAWSTHEPTHKTHGDVAMYAIGPFRTKAGALTMRDAIVNGAQHLVSCVSDAERYARIMAR